MRQIVRAGALRVSVCLALILPTALSAGVARAESDSERAFRERRSDILRSQDPDRVKIDRPQSPVVPKIEGINEGDFESAGRPTNATLSVSVSELAAAAAKKKAEPGILDFWFEGRYLPYAASDSGVPMDGNMSVMYAGTKYMFGPDIMLGALAQFDATQEFASSSGGSLNASGWMTGPYTSVRFGPGIVFDGRMAWGTAETSGNYLGESGGETSERRLVRGTLRGSRAVGGWTVTPSIGMSYIEDKPVGEGPDGAEAGTAIGQGRLEVMPEVKRRFSVNETTFVEPRAAAGGFVAFDDLSKLNHALPGQMPDLQMKAEAGVAVGVKDGLNLEAKGGVETSATPDVRDTWSGRFQLNVPLNK